MARDATENEVSQSHTNDTEVPPSSDPARLTLSLCMISKSRSVLLLSWYYSVDSTTKSAHGFH